MTCACGCGVPVEGSTRAGPRRFVSGHNLRALGPRTKTHRARISEGQRRAWLTKRQRQPIGTRCVSTSGYVIVKVVEGAGHWRPEHVLTIESEMGRRMRPGEHVHHINGIKTDNRRENLYLFTKSGAHTAAHGSLNMLLDRLLTDGQIVFDRSEGRYRGGT